MHPRTFGDASPMHRRSFFQTKHRECIAKISMHALNFFAALAMSPDVNDVDDASPMHRRSIGGHVRGASRCIPIIKK